MPRLLESGKLQLTAEEPVTYRGAAARQHDACAVTVGVAAATRRLRLA